MFLPGNSTDKQKEDERRKAAYKNIETWSLSLIPEECRGDALVSVQEVQCGDPQCAPIDTAITVQFESGQQGMFGLPMEAWEVSMEELKTMFPTAEILQKWHKGEDADWPPEPELPELRFELGSRVLCRLGQDTWGPGTVVMLWYREENWPPGSYAPYQVKLDDGRMIFAPGDMDQVIKANPDGNSSSQPAE
mmetsp:Transcript_14828/g.36277  ORF Transcript_14828/g.36277 Transcript_14828/m.36277 type:complete len:192 (+) Transcript_14828:343-918(+)